MSQELYDRERVLIAAVAKQIRTLAATTNFDHRPLIGDIWKAGKPIHEDEIEVSQGRLIYAIGRILQPKNVYEVGIGPGITAHSLMAACNDISYYGLDNAPSSYFNHTFDVGAAVAQTIDILQSNSKGYVQWDKRDSDAVQNFRHPHGVIDLIHIDGDHSFDHQKRDVEKAICSGAEWLLVDDCNDTEVVTACFAAWKDQWHRSWRGGLLPFIYFEDSRTGSILFHSGMWKHL